MKIIVNGVVEEFISSLLLADYLSLKNINSKTVVIELNGSIIKDRDYSQLNLKNNDVLEILKIMGGG